MAPTMSLHRPREVLLCVPHVAIPQLTGQSGLPKERPPMGKPKLVMMLCLM
jgi:hypothetical protein